MDPVAVVLGAYHARRIVAKLAADLTGALGTTLPPLPTAPHPDFGKSFDAGFGTKPLASPSGISGFVGGLMKGEPSKGLLAAHDQSFLDGVQKTPEFLAARQGAPDTAPDQLAWNLMQKRIQGDQPGVWAPDWKDDDTAQVDPYAVGRQLGQYARISGQDGTVPTFRAGAQAQLDQLPTVQQRVQGWIDRKAGVLPEAEREAWKQNQSRALTSGFEAGALPPALVGTPQGKQFLDQAVAGAASAKAEAFNAGVVQAMESKPDTLNQVGDFLKENWKTLIAPVGLMVALFSDGWMGKLLGAAAAVYGGANLYDRYKAVTDPADPANRFINDTFAKAAGATAPGPNGAPVATPFATLDEHLAQLRSTGVPEDVIARTRQGVLDLKAATYLGLHERMQNQAVSAAQKATEFLRGQGAGQGHFDALRKRIAEMTAKATQP